MRWVPDRLALASLVCLFAALLLPTAASAAITEYSVPTASSTPEGITAGPDGALWFVEFSGNKIGRLTTAGSFSEYPVPTAGSPGLVAITAGPDGALWFTERDANKIGRVTTGGSFTEYPIPTATARPIAITTGPDGALWFAEASANRIGRVTTAGSFTDYPIPTGSSLPAGITAGPDGALWFTEQAGNKIARITTAGSVTEYPVPTASSQPIGIVVGPDGALWFTETTGDKIGRVTTGGAVTNEYAVPTVGSTPYQIAAGPDGALWFPEFTGNKVGRVTTAGSFSEDPVPTAGSKSEGITAGPDQAIWFTEQNSNKIGRIASHLVPAVADTTAVKLVDNYRQTISTTSCSASGRTNGTHAAPFSMPSCLPPAFAPGTAAALGPGSDSSVLLTTVQDNPMTAPDEADIGVEAHLKNVICLSAVPGCAGYGALYDPNTGAASPDVTLKFKLRLSDNLNCSPPGCGVPFTSSGTVLDFDFKAPIDCTTAAPAASCDLVTSVDAVTGTPSAIAGGSSLNAQVFRVRVADSGADSIRGNGDDKEFAMQGLAVH